jgi:hypothetical protein
MDVDARGARSQRVQPAALQQGGDTRNQALGLAWFAEKAVGPAFQGVDDVNRLPERCQEQNRERRPGDVALDATAELVAR